MGLCGNGVLAKPAKRNIPVLPLGGDMLSKLSIVVDWGKCAKGFKPPRPARRNKEGQAFFVAWGRLQTQQIASTLSALPHPHRHLAGLYLDLDKWGLGGSPIDRYSVSIRCIPHHPSSQVLQEASFFLVLR